MTDSASTSSDPSLSTPTQLNPANTAEAVSLTAEQQVLLTEILQRIRQQAILSGYADPYVPIVVRHGNRRLFEAIAGEAPRCNRIQPEHLELLQAALERPETIQGTFKIFIGSEEVYRIQAGVIKTDLLGLAARSQSTLPTSEPALKTQTAENNASSATAEPTAASVEQKSQTNGNFSEARSTELPKATHPSPITSATNSSASAVSEVVSPSPIASTTANSAQPELERLQTQIQQLEHRIHQLTEQLQSVQSSPARWLAQTEQQLQSWARSIRQTVKRAMAEPMVRSMEVGLRQVVKLFGDTQADGSIAYDSKRDQRYVIDGNRIAVSGRETGQAANPTQTAEITQTPAQLWNQYTQGVQGSPIQVAVQASRLALQNQTPAKIVIQMLHSDPQFQKVQSEQGSQAAQRYAELVVGRASYQALQYLQARENSPVSNPIKSTARQL